MKREPEECGYRVPWPAGAEASAHACELVRRIVGTPRWDAAGVAPELCERCCTFRLPAPNDVNPVIASLVFRAAAAIVRDPSSSWSEREQANRAQAVVLDGLATRSAADARRAEPAGPGRDRPGLRWAVGLTTAPRREPTIGRTLRSLRDAGFADLHIFAEPDSTIPGEFAHLPRTIHGSKLGALGNFHTTLAALVHLDPKADCYAVFQDDIEAARGLRDWCDSSFWPEGAGLVSLYTCGVRHAPEPGWKIESTDFFHSFGAAALVFRRDVLRRFLTDDRLLERCEAGARSGIDGVVGQWACQSGVGIAHHTPSLVGHIGEFSAISVEGHGISGPLTTTHAVASVGAIAGWTRPAATLGRVGLVGWNTPSGLGQLNRDIATHFPIARWLVPKHPRFATLGPPPTAARIDCVPLECPPSRLRAWLRGLDWLLFAELPYFPHLVHYARDLGIQVACIPMWEYFSLNHAWTRLIDLMICPTRYTSGLVRGWKAQFGYGWDVESVAWPIDARRFRYRQRRRCDRFLFVNGTGGSRAKRDDGEPMADGRKGMRIMLDVAERLRPIPFLMYSQAGRPRTLPENIELRGAPGDNRLLYEDGDVCVQPSHWEGLGLQLLECQAAGMPLVTTDAPPMNEFRPLRAVDAPDKELLTLFHQQKITAHHVDPATLAEVLRSLYRADIAEASAGARAFVEREHSWAGALPVLARAFSR